MKKKLTLVVTCIVLVAAMVIGGTLAYFNDTKTAENTFSVGNVSIKLDETDIKNPDGARVTGNDYGSMYPGRSVTKDPIVHNVGANGAYIRAKVTVTNGINLLAALFQNKTIEEGTLIDAQYIGYLKDLVGEFGNGWSVVEFSPDFTTGNVTYVFEYATILAAGENTPAIFEKLEIPADYDGKYMGGYINHDEIKMTIVAEAMQAEGFVETENEDGTKTSAMANAWAAFDKQVNG